jgi:hypothetical protein
VTCERRAGGSRRTLPGAPLGVRSAVPACSQHRAVDSEFVDVNRFVYVLAGHLWTRRRERTSDVRAGSPAKGGTCRRVRRRKLSASGTRANSVGAGSCSRRSRARSPGKRPLKLSTWVFCMGLPGQCNAVRQRPSIERRPGELRSVSCAPDASFVHAVPSRLGDAVNPAHREARTSPPKRPRAVRWSLINDQRWAANVDHLARNLRRSLARPA